MTDIEHLLPWQQRQAIRDKLAQMPANPDHNGHHDLDRAADAATVARITAPPEPVADPEPRAMLPNRAQGSSAAGSVPAPPPANARAAIRAQLAKHDNI
jgi:hypothetical protein